MRYVQGIQPNIPTCTSQQTYVRGRTTKAINLDLFWSVLGTCLYLEQTMVHAHTIEYLVAQNLHGPCFTTPKLYKRLRRRWQIEKYTGQLL